VVSSVPDIIQLLNYPDWFAMRAKNGQRCCTMCGQSHPYPCKRGKVTVLPIIPVGNSGVCTLCERRVWKVLESNLLIKWCHDCTDFRQWAATFGDNRMSKCCTWCRKKSRERKYPARKRKNPFRIEQSTTSPAQTKATGECSISEAAMADVQPDRANTRVHDNHAATRATSMIRSGPLKDPTSSR
jgi:hypothetical protein